MLLGNRLDIATALTSLALFELLRFPLFMFPQVINNVVEATVSVERIQSYLLAKDRIPVHTIIEPEMMLTPAVTTSTNTTGETEEDLSDTKFSRLRVYLNQVYMVYESALTQSMYSAIEQVYQGSSAKHRDAMNTTNNTPKMKNNLTYYSAWMKDQLYKIWQWKLCCQCETTTGSRMSLSRFPSLNMLNNTSSHSTASATTTTTTSATSNATKATPKDEMIESEDKIQTILSFALLQETLQQIQTLQVQIKESAHKSLLLDNGIVDEASDASSLSKPFSSASQRILTLSNISMTAHSEWLLVQLDPVNYLSYKHY
jgi:hypothetical protein